LTAVNSVGGVDVDGVGLACEVSVVDSGPAEFVGGSVGNGIVIDEIQAQWPVASAIADVNGDGVDGARASDVRDRRVGDVAAVGQGEIGGVDAGDAFGEGDGPRHGLRIGWSGAGAIDGDDSRSDGVDGERKCVGSGRSVAGRVGGDDGNGVGPSARALLAGTVKEYEPSPAAVVVPRSVAPS